MMDILLKQNKIYEEMKVLDKDHIATPRFVVENIYKLINELLKSEVK